MISSAARTLVAATLLLPTSLYAQPTPEPPATATPAAAERSLTLAVLDFDAEPGNAGASGGQIAETIAAVLSGTPGITIVDRSTLERSLREHELSLSGLADSADAPRVGRLVGAKLLIVGKAFELGQSRMLTAKLIGTETTLTAGTMVKGDLDRALDEMVLELAEKLSSLVAERGQQLVASPEPIDPIPALVTRLKGAQLPIMAVVIPEEHRGRLPIVAAQPPDPAVETEIKKLLIDAGADVRDVPANELAEWVTQYNADRATAWPQTLEGVELVVVGEAFSEGAQRIGGLRSSAARAEINVISRKDGRIVLADRATTRAVDVAEEVAGKTALEKAGRRLAFGLLTHLAETRLPQAGVGAAPAAEGAAAQ